MVLGIYRNPNPDIFPFHHESLLYLIAVPPVLSIRIIIASYLRKLIFTSSSTPSCSCVCTDVVNRVTTQGTRVLVAALEPLVQASAVEEVLASLAALVRHLLVAADDAVADGAFRLTLHGADDVATERCKTINNAPTL